MVHVNPLQPVKHGQFTFHFRRQLSIDQFFEFFAGIDGVKTYRIIKAINDEQHLVAISTIKKAPAWRACIQGIIFRRPVVLMDQVFL